MPETASRNAASMSAVAFAALSRTLEGSRTTRRVAAGATVCTISKSETSSGVACHGEAAPARAVTTWIRAAGSPNSLSKASRSWRISVAAGGSLLPGDVLGDGTGETTVTVSPRPSIPRSSKGWTPYATRYWCRPRQGARPPPGAGGTPGRAGRQLLTVPDGARPVGTVVATVAAGPAAVADPKVTAGPGLAGLDTKVAAPRAGAAAELPELPEHPASAKAAAATRTASPPAACWKLAAGRAAFHALYPAEIFAGASGGRLHRRSSCVPRLHPRLIPAFPARGAAVSAPGPSWLPVISSAFQLKMLGIVVLNGRS